MTADLLSRSRPVDFDPRILRPEPEVAVVDLDRQPFCFLLPHGRLRPCHFLICPQNTKILRLSGAHLFSR